MSGFEDIIKEIRATERGEKYTPTQPITTQCYTTGFPEINEKDREEYERIKKENKIKTEKIDIEVNFKEKDNGLRLKELINMAMYSKRKDKWIIRVTTNGNTVG